MSLKNENRLPWSPGMLMYRGSPAEGSGGRGGQCNGCRFAPKNNITAKFHKENGLSVCIHAHFHVYVCLVHVYPVCKVVHVCTCVNACMHVYAYVCNYLCVGLFACG